MSGEYADWNTADLLMLLQYAQSYDDWPKNFVPPGLSDPDYVAPNIGNRVTVTAITTAAIALVVVVARLWTRRFERSRAWGFDDWLVIFATLGTIGFTVTEVLVVKYGCVGKHSYDCHLSELKYSFTFEYVSLVVYLVSIFLIKFSILEFIYRLTADSDTIIRRVVVVTFFCILAFFCGIFLMVTFNCRPIAATWSLQVRLTQPYKCMPIQKTLVGWATVYAATDVWLLILPSILVWKLHMPIRSKVGVILIFSLGLTATVAAFVKAVTVHRAYNTYDAGWAFVPVLISSHLELVFGLIAASLPALNFLLARVGPKLLSPFQSLSGLRFSPTKYLKFWKRSDDSKDSRTPELPSSTWITKTIEIANTDRLDLDEKYHYVQTKPPRYYENDESYVANARNISYGNQQRYYSHSQTTRSSETRPESEISLDLVIQHPGTSADSEIVTIGRKYGNW